MSINLFRFTMVIALLAGTPVAAQRQQSVRVDPARERARQPYQEGMERLSAEDFGAAVKAFEQAVQLDPAFAMAYYMLGRTHMMMRNYASAILTLTKCRDLHLAESSTQSLNRQEIQHQRRQRIDEISERIAQLENAIQTAGGRNVDRMRNEIQMLRERSRQIGDAERQLTPEQAVPSYVSLALGSAYFRSDRLPEAEQAYLATIAADPKVGEAYSNLAVVYMETKRFDAAERAVRDAEKAGLKVNPQLKEEIKNRRKAGIK